MVYFTFGESPDGVYKSQVIDTVNLIRSQGRKIRLVSMVSPRIYFSVKKELQSIDPSVIVLPYLIRYEQFELNSFIVKFYAKVFRKEIIICRGILATNLIQRAFKSEKIVYDGRGATWAEQKEFNVFKNTGLEERIEELERKAVLNSDYQVAVSQKLVDYWKSTFEYNQNRYQIIPCLTSLERSRVKTEIESEALNKFLELNQKKIKLVFSGGSGKWQNMEAVIELLDKILSQNDNTSAILLTSKSESILNLINKYEKRVIQDFVKADQVQTILSKCDYGILLRKNLVTNKVASPVKVAEYLLAGLKVIISDNVGDYSEYIVSQKLGVVYTGQELNIQAVTEERKKEIREIAKMNFTKEKYTGKFYQF